MKKIEKGILGLGIVLSLISGNVLADSIDNLDDKNLSEEYLNYLSLSDEEKKNLSVIPEKYYVDYNEFFEKYNSEYKKYEESEPIDEATTIPTSFDLRTKFKINVENQGPEGNCWIFATLGSMRTHLALKNSLSVTPNLSERHLDYLASNLYSDKGFSREEGAAGNFSEALRYFMNNDGPVLESKAPYSNFYSTAAELKALDDMKPDYYVHKIIKFPYITVKDGKYYNKNSQITDAMYKSFQDTVKKHIMSNGGVYCSVRTNAKFADSKNKHYNQFDDGSINSVQCGGHAITVIGWDDNYSKDNFYGAFKPSKNGAWLALNSYGDGWGENGTQWISYEDYLVNSSFSGFLSVDKTSKKISQTFKNKELYEAVRDSFTGHRYPITNDDNKMYISMVDLIDNINLTDSLYLSGKGMDDEDLKNLSAFSYPNMTSLNISNNKITDISSIINYKSLKILTLNSNKISDIGVLSQLQDLVALSANSNLISNIDCLSVIPNLGSVKLKDNQISNYHVNPTNYDAFDLKLQNINYATKLAAGDYEVEYPIIISNAKKSSNKIYSSSGLTFVGCKENSSGTGILVDKTASEVYVSINDGNASGTKFSVTKYDKLKKGDVNKDGKIDLVDVFLTYNKYLKYSSASEISWEDSILTDLDSDNKVDLLDVFLDYNKYLKGSSN